MCTEPAQIIGRLKLLRRIAYCKARGYDWPAVRRLYAAILRAIETREYTWESNFDRFEAMLYTKPPRDRESRDSRPTRDRASTNKIWYCQEWNKPGGCSKVAPHNAWFGTGDSAVRRLVHHVCGTCMIKDKVGCEHVEGQDECPHRD